MKIVGRISFILFVIFGSILVAQTTFIGSTVIGSKTAPYLPSLKSLGLVVAFEADSGINLYGTNVQTWIDLTGNGNNASMYNPANQPTWLAAYGTNTFPAVYFSGSSRSLTANSAAAAGFSGTSKGMTMIVLANSDTNSAANDCIALGWTSAIATTASILAIRPNGTSLANAAFLNCYDTNLVLNTVTASQSATNKFIFFSGTTDGSTIEACFNNLRIGSDASVSAAQRTINTLTMGALTRSNATVSSFWRGGIAGAWVFTNYNSPTAMTNIINLLNTKYKVF